MRKGGENSEVTEMLPPPPQHETRNGLNEEEADNQMLRANAV